MPDPSPPNPEAPQAFDCDVLVIGGGPAGSAVAALLARQGRRVLLLEKARHPRFHIGESLLPASLPLLEELGVREEVEAIGMPKWGVEFCSREHGRSVRLDFAQALNKSLPMAWQVRRSAFDEILFRNAVRCGATALEGCQARRVATDGDGATVEATLDDGQTRRWRTRFIVDATGRDTLMATLNDWKQRNPRHNSAALFAHFRGATRLPGPMEGHISIFWFKYGWFWFIPLADGTTSVGAVCWPHYLKSRDKSLQEFFADTLAMAPELARRLEGAQMVDDRVWATGNYTYRADRCAGERYVLLGDAYAFIDPVFSSGVHLAIVSAFEGAKVVATTLDRPHEAAAARRRFERVVRHGPREFSWFIYRMTNPTLRDLFMNPRNPLRMQEAVLSLLAGDIYGRTPWRLPLALFKVVYHLGALVALPRTLRAWRSRRFNIRDVGRVDGENVLAQGS